MAELKNPTGLVGRLFGSKRARIILLVLLALALLFGVFRLCSGKVIAPAKVYRIARNITWPPLELTGKEPYITAFTTDLLTDIAHEHGLRLALINLTNVNLFEGLREGSYDAILLDITPDTYMHEHFDLSNPIILTGPVVIVPEQSNVHSLKQLENKGGVGVRAGAPIIFKLSQEANIQLVSYDNMVTALDDLEKGVLVGVVMNHALAHTYTEGFYKGRLRIATAPLTDEGIRLIAHWDTEGEYLIDNFDKGLKQMRASGDFEKLVNKWTLLAK